jgi:hypothetical protein
MSRLLNEQRIKRFMTLAGNARHADRFINEVKAAAEPQKPDVKEEDQLEEDLDFFLEEDSMEELGPYEDVDPMAEMGGMPPPKEGHSPDHMGEMGHQEDMVPEELMEEEDEDAADDMGDDPEGDMDEEAEVDVTVDEEQLASLRTAIEVLQSIVEAGDEEGAKGDDMAGDDMAGGDMGGMPDAEPAGGEMAAAGDMDAGAPPEGEDEEEPEALAESKYLDEITAKVLNRVTKRLLKK